MNAPHHTPQGYRNPWPLDGGAPGRGGGFLKWRWERLKSRLEPNPARETLLRAEPDIARPAAAADELRVTWIGHSTFLIQIGAINMLTDPMFSERASPVTWAGPRRLRPPAVLQRDLPPIHAIMLSHDHFDHLDVPSVRWLARAFPNAEWFTPLGYADWLGRRGVARIRELDWWNSARLGTLELSAVPAQHWCARGPLGGGPRLWCAWAIRSARYNLFFGGDSGYCPAYREVGGRLGPFDVVLLPIGAYAPRWFMRAAHMDAEDAVQAYRDLGGEGHLIGMHWGTFRLSDEPLEEPPIRMRAAWAAAGLPEGLLHVDPPGFTLVETRHVRAT